MGQLLQGDPEVARRCLAQSYAMAWQLECFTKPGVSLIDGAVAGAGAAFTIYGTHRVAGAGARIADAPMAPLQVAIVSLCVLLNMLDGMDVVALSFAAPVIATELGLVPGQVGALFSAGLFGMMLGCLFIAPRADTYGRKPVLLASLAAIAAGEAAWPELRVAAAEVARAQALGQAARAERAPDLALWAGYMASLRGAVPLHLEEFDWNWKMFHDECYHCMFLHSSSWGDMYELRRHQTLDEACDVSFRGRSHVEVYAVRAVLGGWRGSRRGSGEAPVPRHKEPHGVSSRMPNPESRMPIPSRMAWYQTSPTLTDRMPLP